uniref:Uncharacterized protein n=1 Tax=Trieres chinensis TaxID=1514140 RepID=A0A7S2A676_TRICV
MMEPDSRPKKSGWLDKTLEEMSEKAPFAIMRSKYKGHSWDSFKDIVPLALLEHINGNAAYNLTHPMMQAILDELDSEQDSYFNAIPYDYRISQMITEGSTGIKSDFPFPKMKDENGITPILPIQLPDKMDKFKEWWNKWGSEDPVKESGVIANFAATNYLPEHLGDEPIIHGKGSYQPWDPALHEITLVVSDWNEGFSDNLLQNLDQSDHPFSEVVVMHSLNRKSNMHATREEMGVLQKLSGWLFAPSSPTRVPLRHVRRDFPDFMDLCEADVKTEWFMHTNAYHHVSPDVDLMFTHDKIPRPVIPFTPANTSHCTDYDACVEAVRLAKKIYPQLDKVILDTDMVYHTPSRDSFCDAWKEENGELGEALAQAEGGLASYLDHSTPQGPIATGYVAYLLKIGMADNLYEFTNRLHYGSKDPFVHVHIDAERERYGMLMAERRMESPRRRLESSTCAVAGELSLDCGASGIGVFQSCCSDLELICGKDGACVNVGTLHLDDGKTQGHRKTQEGYGVHRKRGLRLSEPGLLIAT